MHVYLFTCSHVLNKSFKGQCKRWGVQFSSIPVINYVPLMMQQNLQVFVAFKTSMLFISISFASCINNEICFYSPFPWLLLKLASILHCSFWGGRLISVLEFLSSSTKVCWNLSASQLRDSNRPTLQASWYVNKMCFESGMKTTARFYYILDYI